MRSSLVLGCILFFGQAATAPACDTPRTDREATAGPDVQAILREASELALKQDEEQNYWTQRVLRHIAKLQTRVRDFDVALRSIRGSNDRMLRNFALSDLAEAHAREGRRDRAFEILRLQDSDGSWDDGVQLQWIEHLIAWGDLGGAAKAIEKLHRESYRLDGQRRLAIAYVKSGDEARAKDLFTLIVETASGLKDDDDRARAIWETAGAQLTLGNADGAKATIRQLLETIELKDPRAKVNAFRECAVLCARANDVPAARRLFGRAIEAHHFVHPTIRLYELKRIAIAQAGAGLIEDAVKTAWLIKHSDKDFGQDSEREEALVAVAIAQLKANDADSAVRTALSVKYFVQYRDDALHKVVDHQIAKRDLKAALATAEKCDNPSRKATAILEVATAHARLGEHKTANDIAARIKLTEREDRLAIAPKMSFDHRLPRTWGICYDAASASTMSSLFASVERAAEVAAAAMTLSQALGHKYEQSFAVLFNDIVTEEIIRALARAHAATGDAKEALAWAKQIGSSGKAKAKDDYNSIWAIRQRINALIGVAEGILERSGGELLEK